MTLSDYGRMLRRWWYLVLTGVLLGGVAGGLIGLIVPPTYTAQAALYFTAVATDTTSGTVSAYDAYQLAQQQVKSISLLTSTDRVAQGVIQDLGLPLTPAQLERKISATSDPNTVILLVSAEDSSPQLAAAIANSTSQALRRLSDTINQRAVAEKLPSVVATVIQPAVTPPFPSSGTTRLNVLGGLAAGLLLGLAAALLRGVTDRTVRTEAELRDAVGAPVLGRVPVDESVNLRPLAVHENPDSDLAEHYRRLRLGLYAALAKRQVVAVVSPGRSDGRTGMICNLALAFTEAGLDVAVVEADLRNPRIADYLGLEDAPGLAEVITGEADLPQVVQRWRQSFDVVLAGRSQPSPGRLLASETLTTAIRELRKDHDVILVDTPPLLSCSDALAVVDASDMVIAMARYGRTRKGEIRRARASLETISNQADGCVLTMVPPARRVRLKRTAGTLERPAAPGAVPPVENLPPGGPAVAEQVRCRPAPRAAFSPSPVPRRPPSPVPRRPPGPPSDQAVEAGPTKRPGQRPSRSAAEAS